MNTLPARIVWLTTETVEVLYGLGQADRIVGVLQPESLVITHGLTQLAAIIQAREKAQ